MNSFTKNNINTTATPYNWATVGSLFFLTGIAGIPAIFAVTIVALNIVGITIESTFINNIHLTTPSVILVHGGSGVLFFLTMPFQFSPRFRKNSPTRHRLAGRIAVLSGCIMAISGIWMHNVLSPESQGIRYIILILTSVAICFCFVIAIKCIVKGHMNDHQKWMARAVAIILAAITPLFIDILILVIFSEYEVIYKMLIQFQYDYGRLLAVAINLAIIEIVRSK